MSCVLVQFVYVLWLANYIPFLLVYISSLFPFISGGNLALRKPAFQSIDKSLDSCFASNAVDGFKYINMWENSCTHTSEDIQDPPPWWLVDLQAECLVQRIVITNRGDCCGKSTCVLINAETVHGVILLLSGTYKLLQRIPLCTISLKTISHPFQWFWRPTFFHVLQHRHHHSLFNILLVILKQILYSPLKSTKNSVTELAVIWGNSDFGCSDFSQSDFGHSDFSHYFVKNPYFFTQHSQLGNSFSTHPNGTNLTKWNFYTFFHNKIHI